MASFLKRYQRDTRRSLISESKTKQGQGQGEGIGYSTCQTDNPACVICGEIYPSSKLIFFKQPFCGGHGVLCHSCLEPKVCNCSESVHTRKHGNGMTQAVRPMLTGIKGRDPVNETVFIPVIP